MSELRFEPKWSVFRAYILIHCTITQPTITLPISMCVLSRFSHIWVFVTVWTGAHQATLSMGYFRQEYWSGLPCPPPGGLSNPGRQPMSLECPALESGFFTTSTTWEAYQQDWGYVILFRRWTKNCSAQTAGKMTIRFNVVMVRYRNLWAQASKVPNKFSGLQVYQREDKKLGRNAWTTIEWPRPGDKMWQCLRGNKGISSYSGTKLWKGSSAEKVSTGLQEGLPNYARATAFLIYHTWPRWNQLHATQPGA